MFVHERHNAISKLLAKEERITVAALQEKFNISSATLRRDLAEMEKDGRIVRVHGGVVHPQTFRGELSFLRKSQTSVDAKRSIAKAASELVPDGASVFVDSGTTCLEIGRNLLARSGLTLITNSIPLLYEAYMAGVPIVSVGGQLRAISGALTGAASIEWCDQLRADWAFVGASAVGPSSIATTELEEAAVKRQFLRHSRRSVLAADGTKWNQTAPVRFASWTDFEFWLTSDVVSTAAINPVKDCGLRILRCKS